MYNMVFKQEKRHSEIISLYVKQEKSKNNINTSISLHNAAGQSAEHPCLWYKGERKGKKPRPDWLNTGVQR